MDLQRHIDIAEGAVNATVAQLKTTAFNAGVAVGRQAVEEQARVEIERLNQTVATRDERIRDLEGQLAAALASGTEMAVAAAAAGEAGD